VYCGQYPICPTLQKAIKSKHLPSDKAKCKYFKKKKKKKASIFKHLSHSWIFTHHRKDLNQVYVFRENEALRRNAMA
jgi:hypothetical protein